MSTITTADATQIYYKDWGAGQPVVFSHGWPLSADAWEDQMLFLAARGIRASVLADRSQFFRDLSAPFYGANRPGAKVSIRASALRSSKIVSGIGRTSCVLG
jgi:pimeloyl-ACP methyl ester carboxylesterase